MMTPTETSGRQSELADRWLERIAVQTTRARELVGSCSPDHLRRQPSGGGWSAAQVLEHLVIAADRYHDPMQIHAADGPFLADPAIAEWRAGWLGGFIVRALQSPRKARAPKPFRPVGAPREDVLEAFCTRHQEVARLLAASRSVDWRRCRFRSPVLPIGRMNLGDCFAVTVAHVERHLGQIERALAS